MPTLLYPAPPGEQELEQLVDTDPPQLVDTAWSMIAKVVANPRRNLRLAQEGRIQDLGSRASGLGSRGQGLTVSRTCLGRS